MNREHGERRVERIVGERQRFCEGAHDRRRARGPLGDHGGRRFDCDHFPVGGLVVTRARADVHDATAGTERGVQSRRDARLGPTGAGV